MPCSLLLNTIADDEIGKNLSGEQTGLTTKGEMLFFFEIEPLINSL